jgi:hypothetical protein
MPEIAYLVVPAGTVLPRDLQVCVVDGFAYETDPAGEHIAVDTAIDVFDNVARDIYQLCLAPECNIAYDVEVKVIEGRNFVPGAAWSAVFHTFVNEDDVYVTVHHDGQVGQVIFCGDDAVGDVRLQLGFNYSVNEENLMHIRNFGRLVRAINGRKHEA